MRSSKARIEKAKSILEKALRMALATLSSKGATASERKTVASMLFSLSEAITKFSLQNIDYKGDGIPELIALSSKTIERLQDVKRKTLIAVACGEADGDELGKIGSMIIEVGSVMAMVRRVKNYLYNSAYFKDIGLSLNPALYKGRYSIAVYDKEGEIRGVFDNVQELSSQLEIPLRTARVSISFIFVGSLKRIRVNDEYLTVEFIDVTSAN